MCLSMEPVRYDTRTSEERGRDMIVLGNARSMASGPLLQCAKASRKACTYSPFPETSRHARVLHVSICIK